MFVFFLSFFLSYPARCCVYCLTERRDSFYVGLCGAIIKGEESNMESGAERANIRRLRFCGLLAMSILNAYLRSFQLCIIVIIMRFRIFNF